MKTLANCTTAEFLRQTNKIRHAVSEYLNVTEILEIRKHQPVFPENCTEEERKSLINKQARKNISDMLDNALDENAEKTVEILGLLCFKKPEEAQEMQPSELLDIFSDVVLSKRTIDFFTKLMQSGLTGMADTSRK